MGTENLNLPLDQFLKNFWTPPVADTAPAQGSNDLNKFDLAFQSSPFYNGNDTSGWGDRIGFARQYYGLDNLGLLNQTQDGRYTGQYDPKTGTVGYTNITDSGGLGEWLGPLGVMAGAAGIGGLMGGAFSGIGGAASGGTGAFDMGGMGANFGNYVSPAVGATGATGMGDLTDITSWLNDPANSFANDIQNSTGTMLGDGGSGGILQNLPSGSGSAASSLISKLMQGGISGSDLTNLLGKLGAAGLQAYSSNNQANQLGQLAQQYQAFGAPSRARYEASMTPGFDPNSIPGYAGALDSTSKSVLARLSATGGNPFGNPAGLVQANKDIVAGTALPAIQNYQGLNANTGFGQAMNGAMQLQQQQIGAQSNVPAALASGLGSITAPDNSLTSLLAQLKGSGLTLNNGF